MLSTAESVVRILCALAWSTTALGAVACLFSYRLTPGKKVRLGVLMGIAATSLVFAIGTAWLYVQQVP